MILIVLSSSSGFGTSHKVNNIIAQPGKFSPENPLWSPKAKRSRRSFILPEKARIPFPARGKRKGPGILKFMRSDDRDFLMADQEVLSLIWIMSRKMSIPQIIPSWTGFNISIRNDIAVVTTALG